MTKIMTNVILVYYCLVVLFPKTVKEKTEKAKPNS